MTKAEKISKIPIEDIVKMGGNERPTLEKYVKILRTSYNTRMKSIKKSGEFSHADQALKKSLKNSIKKPVDKMTRNQLLLEFAAYSSFFNSQTSSIKGIRKVNIDQDKRLFGTDKRGRPLRRMSNDERERFWDLYDEFAIQKKASFTNFGYNQVQEYITKMVVGGVDIVNTNLMELLDTLEDSLDKGYYEENVRSVPNVYSGRGDVFPF